MRVAEAEQVPVLDLNALSHAAVQALGQAEADTLKAPPRFDRTHLGPKGAALLPTWWPRACQTAAGAAGGADPAIARAKIACMPASLLCPLRRPEPIRCPTSKSHPQLRPALDLSVTEFDELAQLTAIDVIALDADSAGGSAALRRGLGGLPRPRRRHRKRPAPAPGARRGGGRALALQARRAAAHARPCRRTVTSDVSPSPKSWAMAPCARRRLLCADRRPPLQALHGQKAECGLHRPLCAAGPAHGHASTTVARSCVRWRPSRRARRWWASSSSRSASLGVWLMHGWLSLLPIAASCIGTFSLFFLHGLRMRALMLVGTGLWLVNNLLVGSIGGTLLEERADGDDECGRAGCCGGQSPRRSTAQRVLSQPGPGLAPPGHTDGRLQW